MRVRLAAFMILFVGPVLLFPLASSAQDARAVEVLKSKGFTTCAESLSTITEFLYEKESFAYLSQWNEQDTDRHTALTLTSKPYSDGTSLAAITTTQTPAGTCDMTFTQIFVFGQSCTSLREKTFADWKYYGELEGIPMYEDPTAGSVVVVLAPFKAASCLVVKSGILFLER
jgi:hypothetical protein